MEKGLLLILDDKGNQVLYRALGRIGSARNLPISFAGDGRFEPVNSEPSGSGGEQDSARPTPGNPPPQAALDWQSFPSADSLNPSPSIPQRLLRAVQYIEHNLANRICLKAIAEQACLSKYHFIRLFKKHIGVTPLQFILTLRISQATILLGRTDLSISKVAIRTGFSNLSEFYKQFKKVHGLTPAEFRASAAKRLSPPIMPQQADLTQQEQFSAYN